MRRILAPLAVMAALGAQAQFAPCDVSVSVTSPTCPGLADGAITVVSQSGGPYLYEWVHDALLTDATANNLIAGVYTVEVTGFDCDTIIDVVVTDPVVPPLGTLDVTDLSCAGADDGAITLTLNPGGPFIWFWTHDPVETNTTITDLPIGVYGVLISPPIGCPSYIEATLGDPDVNIIGEPLAYCPNQAPLLSTELVFGFQPHIYEWGTGDTLSTYQVPPGTNATITVTATDTVLNCVATATVDVTELVPPFAVPLMVDTACQNVAFIVNTLATNGDSLEWTWGVDGYSNARDPLIAFPDAGWQHVTLQAFDLTGCGNLPVLDSIFIVAQTPAVFTARQIPCTPIVEISLGSLTADSCAFYIGDSLVTHDCTGFIQWDHGLYDFYPYTLFATQANGCNDTTTTIVDVRTEPTLFLANAFTPNNDGINDTWPVRVDIPELGYELRMFNRWGESIWVTNNPQEQWDASGIPMGVYVYTMKMRDPCSTTNEIVKQGHVTLFR
ncbi:MAG: gliding motility-associated C-terminal domain-containing protein [Flavobacteriales bacterium]|jgi:gliding motility-associated-like protein|nr:gliding motility-associated C-terminal domain-containing protein [Flavobacteriales bacterium]